MKTHRLWGSAYGVIAAALIAAPASAQTSDPAGDPQAGCVGVSHVILR